MEINWWPILGVSAVLLFCILPLILVGFVVFFGAQRGRELLDQMVMPDPDQLTSRFIRMRKQQHRLNDAALVQRIINRESLKCAAIGFVTGFGGIPLLPITVPIDAIASMRIQAVMVQFIARAYGHVEERSDVERVKTYLILAGSRQLTTVTNVIIRRIFIRVFLRSALKVVPVLGGVIGAIANFLSAQAIGHLAMRWYRGDLRRLGLNELTDSMIDQLERTGAMRRAAERIAQEDALEGSATARDEPPALPAPEPKRHD